MALAACPAEQPADDPTVRPVFCYRNLDRQGAGALALSGPIPCKSGGERWRAQGPREHPDAVDLLSADGQVQMGYRIGYRSPGQVAWEERRLLQRPDGVTVYELGRRYEFKTGPEGSWEEVTIRTKLDEAGRPIRVEKRVAGRLEFRVERTYSTAGLQTETTFDAEGTLRLRSRFFVENGKPHEEMFDGQGKLLLRREAPPGRENQPGRVLGARPGTGSSQTP